MNDATTDNPLPPIPAPFTLPFYYAALSNCDVYYLVDSKNVVPYLDGTGLTAASFGGRAVVAFNYQIYAGQFSAGLDVPPEQWPTVGGSFTQELELNVIAYPTALAAQVADVSFEEFLLGDEQSKTRGNHRVHVPCDSDMAIQAGEQLFGEPKFKTSFRANIPAWNPVRAPGSGVHVAWVQRWGFRVNDPKDDKSAIFTCVVDLDGLTARPANPSPITEYGTFQGRTIGCRWNILQPMELTMLAGHEAPRVRLMYGDSTHADEERHAEADR